MSPAASLTLYCLLILLASLAGGLIPHVIQLTHKRMELAVSFVAGVMLGVGLLHMLPHAFQARIDAGLAEGGSAVSHGLGHELINPIVLWLLAGFLVMFFMERFFCFHHHDAPPGAGASAGDSHDACGHDHRHVHHHHHHAAGGTSRHRLTWTGAAVGLSIHSLIEGIALAASVEIGRGHGDAADGGGAWMALGTFLVIFLHKPFDSLTIGTLMNMDAGRSAKSRHLVNIAFSMLIPVGVGLFYLGLSSRPDGAGIVSAALAFSAGTFLCIAMSDLLPELQFHQHDRGKLSAALLAGLAVAWLVGMLESRMHGHAEHPDDQTHEHHDH